MMEYPKIVRRRERRGKNLKFPTCISGILMMLVYFEPITGHNVPLVAYERGVGGGASLMRRVLHM